MSHALQGSAGFDAHGDSEHVAALARAALKLVLFLIVLLCSSSLNPAILPEGIGTQIQQAIAILCWFSVAALSMLIPPVTRFPPSPAMIALCLFYGYVAASCAWSDEPTMSVLKVVALLITTFGGYRLAVALELDDIISCFVSGLAVAMALSVVFVIIKPDAGITHSWMHEGLWQGIYASKQSLGTVAALLLFFSFHVILTRGFSFARLIPFGLAALCVFGSGSRGGGAMAIAAILVLVACRRSLFASRALTFVPLFFIALSFTGSMYLLSTGDDAFHFGDTEINFTERTLIWQHALSHWWQGPTILGYGLNGFWTNSYYYDLFRENHGWVLDDFHSGYLAILVDTGLVGFALFTVSYILYAARMQWLLVNDPARRNEYTFAACSLCVLFQINLTETVFLRSTSVTATLVFMLLLVGMRTAERPTS